jgi:hypothetical protein
MSRDTAAMILHVEPRGDYTSPMTEVQALSVKARFQEKSFFGAHCIFGPFARHF